MARSSKSRSRPGDPRFVARAASRRNAWENGIESEFTAAQCISLRCTSTCFDPDPQRVNFDSLLVHLDRYRNAKPRANDKPGTPTLFRGYRAEKIHCNRIRPAANVSIVDLKNQCPNRCPITDE